VAQVELHQVVVGEVEDYFILIVIHAQLQFLLMQEHLILLLEVAVLVVTHLLDHQVVILQ
jgi:hypothetical protein